jgi:hypothetical protein
MLNRTLVQDLILALVLFVAAYFSAAALVALPPLSEDPQDVQADLNELKTLLAIPERSIVPRRVDFFDRDPFESVSTRLERRPLPVASLATEITGEMNGTRALRDRVKLEHDNALASWSAKVAQGRSQATAAFAENLDRKGNAERRRHFSRLLLWFDDQLGEAQREVNECVAAAEMADKDSRRWSDAKLQLLNREQGPEARPVEMRWNIALEQCDDRWEFPALPDRPDIGERFGPFRAVADWLVKTESLSLVAIVGLFGFGLLGAAASTIVRERGGKRRPGEALVSDLPSVMVRGMTAAIVVFLAVKGGLAVFAAGTPEPNPYVFFLTCLIAAIFSEPVFEAAQAYLRDLASRWGQDDGKS